MGGAFVRAGLTRYAYAATPRWLAAHVAIALVAASFVSLGLWQLRRHDERTARDAALARAEAADPVPLAAAAPVQRVVLAGRYGSPQLLVTGRSLDGRPGDHVVAPIDVGTETVWVNRGWIPVGSAAPRPPSGRVRVTGVLLPGEGRDTSDAHGRLRSIDLNALAKRAPGTRTDGYVHLQSQQPEPGDLPRPAPLPKRSSVNHLSYAIQWFLLAAVGLIGWVAYVRSRRPATAGV